MAKASPNTSTRLAVIPFLHRRDKERIVLVTRRSSQLWTLPKGNPEPNVREFVQASIEAWEEAGVAGRIFPNPIGEYVCQRSSGEFRVRVYLMIVDQLTEHWPEMDQRSRIVVSCGKARTLLDD